MTMIVRMVTCVLISLLVPISAHAQPTNRLDVVRAVKARLAPTVDFTHGPGECGRFEITKRVAWALRGEGVGLLLKTGAQNKCNEENSTDSPGYGVDVIMYADGVVVDILGGGSEGPNTPLWLVNPVPAPLSSWRSSFDPGDGPVSPLPTPPIPPAPPTDPDTLTRIEHKIDDIATSLEAHRVATRNFADKVLGFLKDPRTIMTVVGIVAGRFVVPGT